MKRAVFSLLAALPLAAQSPWLPAPKKAVVTTTFVWQGFGKVWVGKAPVNLSSRVSQRSFLGSVEFGVARNVAVDAAWGHSLTDSRAFGGPNRDSGLTDTSVGLRVRVVDESRRRFAPTLTVRGAANIKGTYRPNYPFSAGDGASGGEVALLWGKVFGESGFGAYGDAGFRKRSKGVPNDGFGSAGIYKALGRVNVSAGYRHVNGVNGMNLGDPGFTFPRVKEVVRSAEFGVGCGKGKRYYQVFAAHTLSGRNTGQKFVVGISVSFRI